MPDPTPLEFEAYALTKKTYDQLTTVDPGGFYSMIDGQGLCRGTQPIAGPCPVDVTLVIDSVTASGKTTTLSGGFQTVEDPNAINTFFSKNRGSGGRTLRVYFTYTSSVTNKYEPVDLEKSVIGFADSGLTPDSGVIGIFTANLFGLGQTVTDGTIPYSLLKLLLVQPDSFTLTIERNTLMAGDTTLPDPEDMGVYWE